MFVVMIQWSRTGAGDSHEIRDTRDGIQAHPGK